MTASGYEALAAEMRRLWGEEILTTVPKATVAARLAPEVVRFLAEAGFRRPCRRSTSTSSTRRWEIGDLGGINRDAGLGEFLSLSPRVVDIATGLDVPRAASSTATYVESTRRSS